VAVLRLILAYDGTGFRGFARQPGHRTVQGELEGALETVTGGAPRISVAGRTDAGVHATGQVVSFETNADPERLGRSLNAMLAPEIAVLDARRAPRGFDARRSASAREYRYVVRTDPVQDPFTARYQWHRPGDYAIGPMRRAAGLLEGEHDFTSFCRPAGASLVRRLERLAVRRTGPVIEVRARADGFLHQMVRSLVGTLVRVGEGRMDPGSMPDVVRSRSRAAAGPVAPPHGLTLVRVVYARGTGP
jgi:tRNA pseudouridine38-40 synthase